MYFYNLNTLNMEREMNEFNLTFSGRNYLGVRQFTNSLLLVNDLLTEINKELQTNKKTELTIKAYDDCCFDVYLQLISDVTELGNSVDLFKDGSGILICAQIIKMFTDILNLKKHLRGRLPKETINIKEDEISVTNSEGTVQIVNKNTYNISIENITINSHIDNLFEGINNIPSIDGLSIKDNKKKNMFEAKRDNGDFKIMSCDNPIMKKENECLQDVPKENAVLSIYNIIFDDTRQWEFYYEGNRVFVKLKDPLFIDRVLKRQQSLLNGDRIVCDLIIHQKFNDIAKVFENKKYSIIKVHEVKEPEFQARLELDETKEKNTNSNNETDE